jgi:trehalose 6-phosphate phosphatase
VTDPAATPFPALLARPRDALVATDYDGTLAPIVQDPAQARPQPGAVEALAELAGLVGQVAVVTGRAALDAVEVGGLDRVPGLVVIGLYGAQRWSADGLVTVPPPPGLAEAERAVRALLAGPAAPTGARVETKGGSVAVHTRGTPDPDGSLRALEPPMADLARTHGLTLDRGRLVLELRAPGIDKGAALRSLVTDRTSFVLFAGDDLGDLPAFDLVAELVAGGRAGARVASASAEAPEVAAAADVVVDGPPGVVALLHALVAALRGAPGVQPG